MTKKILGFDASSTTIGYSIIEIDDNDDIKLIDASYIKPLKKGHIIERISHTRDIINNLINKVKPDYIAIEDIIQFMKGKSTAKTIIMLTTFNRMVGLCAFDYLKRPPELFNVMTIRHGIKIDKKFPAKEEIPGVVAYHLGISFPFELNKKGNIKEENYDKADGIAVALYYAFKLTNKLKTKKTKKP